MKHLVLIAAASMAATQFVYAQYTFGPQVQSTPSASITYNSKTGVFQYTDAALFSENHAALPLAGTAAAFITTSNDWTASVTVSISARSMTVAGGSSCAVVMGLLLESANSNDLVGILLAQDNNTGGGDDSIYPDGWYGTAARFAALTNRNASVFATPLGNSLPSTDGSVYLPLSAATNAAAATESMSAATGALTLNYTASTSTVTGFYNGTPVGSYSLAGWGSNPPLTLAVYGNSEVESVVVSAGTVTASNFAATEPGKYTITASASPSGGGTVSGGGTFASGSSQTVTAKANSGYTFANWTENGSVVSSSASYNFTLGGDLNLVADFVFKGNPKLTISSPKSGQSVSNALLLVTGTVSDKVPVDDVYYQLNGGSWTLATTTNSWTNWTASVTLIKPGANTISAYAVDIGGSISPTNSVKFAYVPTAPLVVQIARLGTVTPGTVTPNYNGKWLDLGANYSMTAKAGKGFAFINWSWSGGSTNRPTLTFMMASNLVFTANFVDVTPPVLVILSPKVHQNSSNAALTVTGKAGDNVGVTHVYCQLNGTGWNLADTASVWTNWTAQVTLSPGTNVVQAYAEDAAGLLSKTNSVNFVYVVPPPADLAPASLSGLSAEATPAGDTNTATFSFGAGTFSASMLPGADEYANTVGSYKYTKRGASTALLTGTQTAPPDDTGNFALALTFTNSHDAVYSKTNDDGTVQSGAFLFSQAQNLAPTSLAGITVHSVDSSGDPSTNVFANGTLTTTDASGTTTGSYTFKQYSPLGGLLTEHYTSPSDMKGIVGYTIITWSASNAGSWFWTSVPPGGGAGQNNFGTFKVP
jgi:hypothetical protein